MSSCALKLCKFQVCEFSSFLRSTCQKSIAAKLSCSDPHLGSRICQNNPYFAYFKWWWYRLPATLNSNSGHQWRTASIIIKPLALSVLVARRLFCPDRTKITVLLLYIDHTTLALLCIHLEFLLQRHFEKSVIKYVIDLIHVYDTLYYGSGGYPQSLLVMS